MQTRNVIVILATLGLVLTVGALTTLCSQNAFAQNPNTVSANGGAGGANTRDGLASSETGGYNSNGGLGGNTGGAIIGGASTGQNGGGGGSSGNTIGVGSTGQTIDRNLFCNTGMVTPICNDNTGMIKPSYNR